ncbi:glycosyltransferase family 2 protein [Exiguobacterium indicum]|uniref:glycosyltransferase family 2 protein n=1 Tax=Exiguobacterium indicum TaxID=296995 RepID=UPI003981F63F
MKKVLILMSTYNGEKYLKQQIDSLLNQSYLNIDILVRDDGSNDKTQQILNEYQKKNQLKWYQGENKKPAKSFLELTKIAERYDYYCFCDQDDIWEKEKVKIAINKLENENKDIPLLYCSSTKLVDDNLVFLGHGHKKKYRLNFGEALVQAISPGCTFVFNYEAKILMDEVDESDFFSMHDYLLLCSVLGTGKVIYDDQSYILYRQHANNVVGTSINKYEIFLSRFNRFFRSNSKNTRLKTAETIEKRFFTKLNADNQKLLLTVVNYQNSFFNKLKLIRNNKIKMLAKSDNILLNLLIMINRV